MITNGEFVWYKLNEGVDCQCWDQLDVSLPQDCNFSAAWKLLLFGDGSPTKLLSILTKSRVVVEVLEMSPIGDLLVGTPEFVKNVSAPRLQRSVVLKNECGEILGYSTNWWNISDASSTMPNGSLPIGQNLSIAKKEIFREIIRVFEGRNETLSTLFGCPQDTILCGRYYFMYSGGKVLNLIYEVFNPSLSSVLG